MNYSANLEKTIEKTFGFFSSEIKRMIIETLGLPDFLKINLGKYIEKIGKTKEYNCIDNIEEFWSDFLGPSYAFANNKYRVLHEYDHIIFEDVTISDWIPRSPGLFYTDELWNKNDLNNIKLKFGDIRLPRYRNMRLFSLHHPKNFFAHPDLSRGIPIILNEDAYKKIKNIMELYGAVHLEKINTTLLSYTPSEFTKNILWPNGWPTMIPTLKGILNIKKPGTPDPLLGTAWTVYKKQGLEEFIWYPFWTGIDYHEYSLKNATDKLKEFIPRDANPLIDFDAKIIHFSNAVINPNNIMKYNKNL